MDASHFPETLVLPSFPPPTPLGFLLPLCPLLLCLCRHILLCTALSSECASELRPGPPSFLSSCSCLWEILPSSTVSIIVSLLTTSHLPVCPNPGFSVPSQWHLLSQRHFKFHMSKVELALFISPCTPSPLAQLPPPPIPVPSSFCYLSESHSLPAWTETRIHSDTSSPLPCIAIQLYDDFTSDNSGAFYHSPTLLPPEPPPLNSPWIPACIPNLNLSFRIYSYTHYATLQWALMQVALQLTCYLVTLRPTLSGASYHS